MPKVYFENEKKTFEVEAGTTLQMLCESKQTPLLFGCRSAACGTCQIEVLDGASNLSAMAPDERNFLKSISAEQNDRLGCQVTVNGDCKIRVV